MKFALTAIVILATTIQTTAPKVYKTEMQVRLLEQTVVTAILNADTNTLKKVWAPEFLVNNPRNRITGNRDSVLISQKAGMIDYSTFE